MAQTLILSNSITEANAYAKLAGLQRFTYRAVRDVGAIKGIRHAEVHLLPSFLKRPDRHRILAELKHARSLEVLYVDPVDFEPDLRGPLTEDQLELAYRANSIFGHIIAERPKSNLSPEEIERLEALLEPEGWEPPETLNAKQVLALAADQDRPAAEVLQEVAEEPTPVAKPPRTKRTPTKPRPTKPKPTPPSADDFFGS